MVCSIQHDAFRTCFKDVYWKQLNLYEKKDKDFNQSSKKIKKYNLNDEQKKAYEFLEL